MSLCLLTLFKFLFSVPITVETEINITWYYFSVKFKYQKKPNYQGTADLTFLYN